MFKVIILLFSFLLTFSLVYKENDEKYFSIATQMLKKYNPPKKDFVVVIDYQKNLFSRRLYLLDMKNKKIILNCQVAHAYESGLLYATKFSNKPQSEKSSYGAFITRNSRPGKYGYSMVIDGLDKGINDNVKTRAIIFHPTTVSYSKGCFATSKENNKKIIDYTKEGSLVYVIK